MTQRHRRRCRSDAPTIAKIYDRTNYAHVANSLIDEWAPHVRESHSTIRQSRTRPAEHNVGWDGHCAYRLLVEQSNACSLSKCVGNRRELVGCTGGDRCLRVERRLGWLGAIRRRRLTRTSCVTCHAARLPSEFDVREMMLGTGTFFRYSRCHGCGSLYLDNPPHDMGRYYPENYYAFLPPNAAVRRLKARRAASAMGRRSIVGRLLRRRFGDPAFLRWFERTNVNRHSRILDVGAGIGTLIGTLRAVGFDNCSGIDAYIPGDINLGGTRVVKGDVDQVRGEYDLVMLHHSFEHMADPALTMKRLAKVVKRGSYLMLRTPVAGTHASTKYGPDWVQLDAPRHTYLPTVHSIDALGCQTGFSLDEVEFDSTAFQFWGSEQYRMGIPLNSPASYATNPRKSPFTRRQIRDFEASARELNRIDQGDQACFYLRRIC